MTDLEMTRLCALAIGHEDFDENEDGFVALTADGWDYYNPLTDDAQAMALVKSYQLNIQYGIFSVGHGWRVCQSLPTDTAVSKDLNRAIVQCVAALKDYDLARSGRAGK